MNHRSRPRSRTLRKRTGATVVAAAISAFIPVAAQAPASCADIAPVPS